VDGALLPWTRVVTAALLERYPGLDLQAVRIEENRPPTPRITIESAPENTMLCSEFIYEEGTLHATVMRNQRITAEDWNQDVRHIEFEVTQHLE
jgi:hypothetical protein